MLICAYGDVLPGERLVLCKASARGCAAPRSSVELVLSFFLMTDASSYKSDGFETSTGTLYVSKPYRSMSSKKLRAQITFAPRSSAFDINNELSVSNEFRVRSCLALSIERSSFVRAFSPCFGSHYLSLPFKHMSEV
jgi:hypothetical protein